MILTIAIPTYNRAADLDNLLQSIDDELKQSEWREKVELLVIDNFSDDETASICLKFKSRNEKLRYVKNENNLGLTRNMYECLSNAKGDYVWVIGDDETVVPGGLNIILSEINSTEKDLYIFNYTSEPADIGEPFLKLNSGRVLQDKSNILIDLVKDLGWLWCLGNLGMVVAKKINFPDDYYETYANCNFAQSAWYIENFKNADAKFVNKIIFRTYIRSQTVNKERWVADGTRARFIELKNTVATLIERNTLPKSLPLNFFNSCSTDKSPFWAYYLHEINEKIKINETDIDVDYWIAILYLVNCLDDDLLKRKIILNIFNVMFGLRSLESMKGKFRTDYVEFLGQWNKSYYEMTVGA